MASKITVEDIEKINEAYYRLKKYAAVARETGFSPSTVKKYVDLNWKPSSERKVIHLTEKDIPDFDSSIFKGIDNYGELCVLTEKEVEEIKELWGEISI